MILLHWRSVGVGVTEGKDPPLKAEAFFPLPRGDFQEGVKAALDGHYSESP